MNKEQDIILKVKEIIKETDDTISIKFENKDINYISGQYLMLKIPYQNKILHRAYSLSSSPLIDEYPVITIKRVQNGKISNFLNEYIKVGDEILSFYPKGNFITQFDKDNNRHIVCIAAGSGITPLISIFKSVLFAEPLSTVSLLYINRDENSIIFNKEIKYLEILYKERLSVINILTRPIQNWSGIKGRPDTAIFESIFNDFKNILSTKSEFFLCGPLELMKKAIMTLLNNGIQKQKIHWESFGESFPLQTQNKQKVDFTQATVKIKYEGQDYQIKVNKGQTILEAALDEDIDIPFACSNGTCNVCQAICLKGNVEMENNDGLTDEEIEQNYILTCVSKPLSEHIEIEIPN